MKHLLTLLFFGQEVEGVYEGNLVTVLRIEYDLDFSPSESIQVLQDCRHPLISQVYGIHFFQQDYGSKEMLVVHEHTGSTLRQRLRGDGADHREGGFQMGEVVGVGLHVLVCCEHLAQEGRHIYLDSLHASDFTVDKGVVKLRASALASKGSLA